ncbi:MAG: TolC family protein [Balneolaceae bacterium]
MRPLFFTLLLVLFPLSISAQHLEIETENPPQKYVWTLEESINYALEHNLTIKQANLDLESVELSYDQSKMERLPNLSGSINQRWSNGSTIDPITSDFINQKSSSTSLGLNSSMILFNGFQINNRIKQNKLVTEQTELLLEETKNNIQISVLDAYVQALYSKEAVSIAQSQLDASEQELEHAEGLFKGRSITLKELNDIQSQNATNQYNLISSNASYQQQLLTLKQLLELDSSNKIELIAPPTDYLVKEELENEGLIYQSALSFLPEVGASKTNIAISGSSLDIAKGGLYPTLSLSGSLSSGYTKSMGLDFTDQLDGNFSQSLGVSLSIPIFNRFSSNTNIQLAKIDVKQAELNYETTKKELYRKIESAWLSASSYGEQMSAAEISREAARSSYELAQAQFNVGEITATDLIVAQSSLNTAELNFIQAKYLTILYTQLLEFYQGNPIKL